MVKSLNEMSAGPRSCGEGGACTTEGQRPAGQEALRALMARRGYDGELATLASLDVDRLALPERGHRA
eukprot:2022675-Pyramimonas_sp.AAC.1